MKMNVKVGTRSRLSSDKAHITDCFSAHLAHTHTHCRVIAEGIMHDIGLPFVMHNRLGSETKCEA